ncbi:MAG: hypothetical protein ACI8X5_000170 [Planctomycetota bacterium]|jgi:hypothetical protein
MEVEIRTVETVDEARQHIEALRLGALEALQDLGLVEAPANFVETFLDNQFDKPETLLLIAEQTPGAADLGFCLVGPHSDPLSGLLTPMILILSVNSSTRHVGLARSLAQEARRQLSARGYKQLAARCAHGDDALISMGERWGFLRTWEFLAKSD